MNYTVKTYNNTKDAFQEIESYLNTFDTSKGDFSIEVDIEITDDFEDCGYSKSEILEKLQENIEKLDQYKGVVCSTLEEQDLEDCEEIHNSVNKSMKSFEYSGCEDDSNINFIEKVDEDLTFYKMKSEDGIAVIFTNNYDEDRIVYITKKFIYENLYNEGTDPYDMTQQISIGFSLIEE